MRAVLGGWRWLGWALPGRLVMPKDLHSHIPGLCCNHATSTCDLVPVPVSVLQAASGGYIGLGEVNWL